LSSDKKAKILEISAREFGAHGFSGASLNHILEQAGISKGAAYYYFDSKADLFGTVIQHYFDHLMADSRFDLRSLDAETFWPMLSGFYRKSLEHTFDDAWVGALSKAVWKLSPEERRSPEFKAAMERPMGIVGAIVKRGQEVGSVRTDIPADLLIDLVVAIDEVCDSWFGANIERIERAELERMVSTLLEMVRAMLEPRPEART
jgi:AcrR family transcriptional regulator